MKRKKISENLFLFGYSCILLAFLLQISSLPSVYNNFYSLMRILRIMGYGCCIMKLIFNRRITNKNAIKILLISTLALLSTFTSGMIVILTDVIFIISSGEISLRKVIKIDVKIRIIFLVIIILLCELGIIPDIMDYRRGILSRHSLGFAHPNRLAMHVFMICLYFFYLKYKKINYATIVIIIMAGVLTLLTSDGRTSVLCIGLIVILSLIKLNAQKKGYKPIYESYLKGISTFILSFSLLISFLFPFLYQIGIVEANPNSTFGMRMYLSEKAINNYGITLFGQKVDTITSIMARLTQQEANGIDNAYVFILINFGILVFFMFIWFLTISLKQSRRSDKAGTLCLFLIIILGILENQVIYIESNLFLLYVGQELFKKKIRINSKGKIQGEKK